MKGYIIEYCDSKNHSKNRIGHVLDCKDEKMLIRNDGHLEPNWIQVETYKIVFISSPKPLEIKSIDNFDNTHLLELLCGTQPSFSMHKYTFSYFRQLLKMLKPLVHVESLFLHGITAHIGRDIFEKFPSLVQLHIDKCVDVDWSEIKKLPICLLRLNDVSSAEKNTINDIVSTCATKHLRSLIIENCRNKWDVELDISLAYGLFQLTVRNCVMSDILLQKDFSDPSRFSSLWIEDAPELRFISPSLIEECDWIHLEKVPKLQEIDISNVALRHIHFSETAFEMSVCPGDNIIQLYLQKQKVANLFELLKNLKRLETLVLRNFVDLPEHSFLSLRKLVTLHIDNTPLPILDVTDCIPSLHNLILSGTSTEEIQGISNLRKLQRITLLFLPLRHIPSGLNQMKELREITFVNLNLENLPQNWTSCKFLAKFYVEPVFFDGNEKLYFSDTLTDIDISNDIVYEFCSYQEFCIRMIEREKVTLPFHLKCIICYSLFRHPCTNSVGHTYCRECISRWMKLRLTDPQTNVVLRTKSIHPNNLIEILLQEFLEKHQNLYDPVSKILSNPKENLATNSSDPSYFPLP